MSSKNPFIPEEDFEMSSINSNNIPGINGDVKFG